MQSVYRGAFWGKGRGRFLGEGGDCRLSASKGGAKAAAVLTRRPRDQRAAALWNPSVAARYGLPLCVRSLCSGRFCLPFPFARPRAADSEWGQTSPSPPDFRCCRCLCGFSAILALRRRLFGTWPRARARWLLFAGRMAGGYGWDCAAESLPAGAASPPVFAGRLFLWPRGAADLVRRGDAVRVEPGADLIRDALHRARIREIGGAHLHGRRAGHQKFQRVAARGDAA